ncbi:hypothetical protein [Paraflavitalea sp. CAU 1676]|uniref:hypothetical protein n=1 Tax=Paraflavitalea sp. CAU 1676 TaxID=3032598 RepID=UPI0023DA9C17|nr:hypothetical protein [Paraflavitalea sp. CAU 1676]MDF2188380.1 hypothetical protein [Paraflavitalea sp. CAU 1676]
MKACAWLIVVLFGSLQLSAQVVNIPDKSKKHFAEKYAKAAQVEWKNNAVSYNASFVLNNSKHTAHYHLDGTWDYTEELMAMEKFPSEVKTSVQNSRFAKWKILSTAYLENSHNEKLYRVEFKKGIERKYVFYDATGKEVKSSTTI